MAFPGATRWYVVVAVPVAVPGSALRTSSSTPGWSPWRCRGRDGDGAVQCLSKDGHRVLFVSLFMFLWKGMMLERSFDWTGLWTTGRTGLDWTGRLLSQNGNVDPALSPADTKRQTDTDRQTDKHKDKRQTPDRQTETNRQTEINRHDRQTEVGRSVTLWGPLFTIADSQVCEGGCGRPRARSRCGE